MSGMPAIASMVLVMTVSVTAAQTVDEPTLGVDVVVSGLSLPTSMAFIGPDDFLVLQKSDGRVMRVTAVNPQPVEVLDVAVHSSSERGLLGIATDPDFINNRLVYLYYTESSTGNDTSSRNSEPLGNRVYRYTWDGIALVDPILILDLPATPGPNHDGGIVAFGPDDALYTVIGDLNRQGTLQNLPDGPDPDDTGVILRTDAAGRAIFDNPFYSPTDPESPMGRYYAYGVRNSFGLAFDPLSGDLWETENGPNAYDEVNRVLPGFNGGWRQLMGPDARDPEGIEDLWMTPGATYRDPEFSWAVPVAPTALIFPGSPVLGCGLAHDLLVGDNNCGQIYRFSTTPERDGLMFSSPELQDRVADNNGAICSREMAEIIFGSGFGVVTDLESGPDGSLYVVSLSAGAVYRVAPSPGTFPDFDDDMVDDGCDCDPTDGGSFSETVEVPRLRPSGSMPLAFGWDPQAAAAGTGVSYTLVSGDLSSLRADRDLMKSCALREGLTRPASSDTRPDPPAGTGHYYLVSASNGCGTGTFGDSSILPDPRDQTDTVPPPACPCDDRTGGAFVTFSIPDESLLVWTTNDIFIDRAQELLVTSDTQIPVFGTLVDGRDCDPQWTWHTDPQDVSFADFTIELCDGLPSHIEADKEYWFNTVGNYCPWGAVVTAVDDRR